jgi:membrane protein
MVLLAPLLLILSGSVTVYITSEVKSLAEMEVLGLIRPFILFTIKLIPYAIVSLLLTLVYIILPNIKVKFIPAAVSGILTGILFQLTQLAWINGQSYLSNYSVVYGTLVVLPLFMIYLQISWTLVLFGAEYAYARQYADTWKYRYESMKMSSNHKRKLVLLIFYHMIENFKSEDKRPLSVSEISTLVDVPYRFIHDICIELEQCELTCQVQDEDAIRYQPALDINQIDMHLVMTKLDANGYEGFKINEDEKSDEIERLMHALDSSIKNSKANLYLKDL